ncbi:hypothetical protein CI109_102494 [Kwoniella shandongensis]|uniref:Zn(2)-C6 fungal-type domain-containing protein n=1 Tax=Kwoniella shandongensis TaxID=1734106 RepID=A0AAJ8LHM5_9TREE
MNHHHNHHHQNHGYNLPPYSSDPSTSSNAMGMSIGGLSLSRRNSLELQNIEDERNDSRDEEQQYESGSGKKRKKGNEDGRVKKTRQSPCRARKVKCDRPPPGTVNPLIPPKDVCSHCSHLGLACTFDYKPKKRGPPNMYVRRMQGEGSASDTPNETPAPLPEPSLSLSRQPSNPSPEVLVTPVADHTMLYHDGAKRDRENWESSMGMTVTSSSVGPGPPHSAPPSTTQYHQSLPMSNNSSPASRTYQTSSRVSSPLQRSGYPNLPAEAIRGTGLLMPQPQKEVPRISPRLPYIWPTHSQPDNPFDAIMPRTKLYQIIDLYFDYIYCLIPCLHKPSLIHDLNMRREERPGQEEWICLVLAVAASTLAQLPRSFTSMTRVETRELVVKCDKVVRVYMTKDFTNLTVERIIMLYHSVFVHRSTGSHQIANGEIGMICAFMTTLHMHDERSYRNCEPIERELRRRCFWLMYGADKTIAAIDNIPTFMQEDYCVDVGLPSNLDDDYITADTYLPQPEGYVPQLCGFRIITEVHQVTGHILNIRRQDKVRPPQGYALHMRLKEIDKAYDRLMAITDNSPPQLRLDYKRDRRSPKSLSPGWDVRAKNDIRAIFLDPHPDTEQNKDFYVVQQANIYVTQQFVRYTIIQYRNELLNLKASQDGVRPAWSESSSSAHRFPGDTTIGLREKARWLGRSYQEEWEEVIIDMLAILHAIPMKVLAVNSFPVVEKVRFVASALLDAINPNEPQAASKAEQTPAQRAQKNLWQFLSILSGIEALYSLTDDPSGSLGR